MSENLMPHLPQIPPTLFRPPRLKRLSWRRLLAAVILVLLLHLIFFLGVAPYLEFDKTAPSRTEVVQISPQQLEALKKKILVNNRERAPLMKQELHEEFKSKEAPKDATMMAPFNQVVPKQKIAGAQHDAPLDGGGNHARNPSQAQNKSQSKAAPQKLQLGSLGFGSKPLPRPVNPEEQQNELRSQQAQNESSPGPQGPPGPFRPVGRDDKNIERGDENMLNAVENEFYSFFVRLEEPIIRNWYFLIRQNEGSIRSEMAARKIGAGAELPVTIEMVIDRQGNLRKVDVIESSGVQSFDQTTRDAVRKLGALPNPPPALFENGQYYTRRLRFMLHVTDAPIVSSRPDLAW